TALWLTGLTFCLGFEGVRFRLATGQPLSDSLQWSVEFLYDTPMFLPLFVVWPICFWLTSGLILHRVDLVRQWTSAWARSCTPQQAISSITDVSNPPATSVRSPPANWTDWGLSIFIGAISLLMSWETGRSLDGLPPAYHDEYSYLLQAQTLLAGRFSYPSDPTVAPIFDQLHVVNQGRFASRYYPGTGVWLAPWVAWGHPVWGQWLAGSLAAMLIFWTARELGGRGVGFMAGCLTALSPGLALFSNLLLAHHPTLLGLAIFLHGFTKWLTHRRPASLLQAGCGLAFAMLCRPATAAGVALPFGIWFFKWLVTAKQASTRSRLLAAALLGLPLVAGWILMGSYNVAITGRWTKSPYQLYTDVYTPRHVFGFNNVTRGAAAQGDRALPLVTRNYDAWAENLTPMLAIRNVEQRLIASLRWTLGLVPLAWIILAAWRLPLNHQGDKNRNLSWNLIAASIVCLHAIHIPYWFDGIMHWHYVFESSILWILLAARSTAALVLWFHAAGKPWSIVWLSILLTIAVVSNYVSFAPFWETRQAFGIAELRYSRKIYGDFRRRIASEVTEWPALVLVKPDPADRHMDFVTNEPSLTAPVLFGRFIEAETPLEAIVKAFPQRTIYVYDAKTRELKKLKPQHTAL
ncbi:MAG: hypothetical protein JWM11_1499, partial [Planctomycetaceae bacterium]|nr:hypothetical protein [Planctomycetaceae bacterium]